MVTFLDTVRTDCTSNSATWRCFPYSTYNDSQTSAMTTFNWIITPGSQQNTYQISSTDNPFSVVFSNVPLDLVDKGLETEHYHFQTTIEKAVIPTVALTDDNASTECFFNGTTFQGYLYTSMAKGYPSPDMTSLSIAYTQWPYAVRAEQTRGGGQSVPDCYKTMNRKLGDHIDGIAAKDAGSQCSCMYRNFLAGS